MCGVGDLLGLLSENPTLSQTSTSSNIHLASDQDKFSDRVRSYNADMFGFTLRNDLQQISSENLTSSQTSASVSMQPDVSDIWVQVLWLSRTSVAFCYWSTMHIKWNSNVEPDTHPLHIWDWYQCPTRDQPLSNLHFSKHIIHIVFYILYCGITNWVRETTALLLFTSIPAENPHLDR